MTYQEANPRPLVRIAVTVIAGPPGHLSHEPSRHERHDGRQAAAHAVTAHGDTGWVAVDSRRVLCDLAGGGVAVLGGGRLSGHPIDERLRLRFERHRALHRGDPAHSAVEADQPRVYAARDG